MKWVTEAALASPERKMTENGSSCCRDLRKLVDPRMQLSTRDYEEIDKVLDVAVLCNTSFPIELLKVKNHKLALPNRCLNSEPYWTSGQWNRQTFILTPNLIQLQNTNVSVSFVSNENETYFIYPAVDPNFITGLIMGASGQVKQMYGVKENWFKFWFTPRQACEVYAYCGAFSICSEQTLPLCVCLTGFKQNSEQDWSLQDYSGGCVRKTQLQCVNNSLTDGKSDRFQANANMLLPNYPQSVPVRSIKDCETSCLNDCSCTGYAYENDECSIWVGNLLNLQKLAKDDPNGKTVYFKLSASEFSSANVINSFQTVYNINKGTVIGGVVGSIVAFLVILGFIMFVYLRRRNRTSKSIKAEEGSLVAFAYKDLQIATNNFSEKLGKGGFGSVFKGLLPNSRFIAVKKLESLSQGDKEFRTEVSTIGIIQHVNLVQLHGFCSQGNKKLLVYEYMPNGSLNSHLFHEKKSKILDWETRYKIALGTAKGLAYLHDKCRDCIIHCDIKPENILLDAEFCPEVADFGLAKLHRRKFSRVLTTIRGTRGYLAPEWLSGNAITTKADVYSYGMMLFEFVSGRRNSEQIKDEKVEYFPTWAASIISNGGGDVLSLLDPKLEGNVDEEEVRRICKVACWCIQDDETHRPSMSQVVGILEGVLDLTLPPIPTSLKVFADNQEFLLFFVSESTH
ncbi:hypothetical protein Dsin_015760 [Dipteronia sinensis]|uniref:non-specific serine/threonine protein kinase n=1 Tax=Dipteronia sinensis TaxID=43782 RepID=A0AAE0E4Z7_9ROSI|nr:hypothetical protein Dsin_015760 [Dipteronia sinensis]